MRRYLIIVAILLVSLGIRADPVPRPDMGRIYYLGVVPQFEAGRIYSIWRPVLDEIERLSGVHIHLRGAEAFSAFEQEFMCGEFDFAYMNAYHVMLARDTIGYIPLVRDTDRLLRGVLVVRNDSPISRVSDLQGQKVAFPAPNAYGATLLVQAELQHDFNVEVEPVYVQTHSSVYLNVALGEIAAGGGVESTLEQQPEPLRKQLRILHTTKPVMPHALVVHPRVATPLRDKVRLAFVQLGSSEYGRRLLARIPITRVGTASMADYESLGSMDLGGLFECM